MASSVSRSRPRCHVMMECRSKIKRDKTPSRQSSTPDGEDSGVQLDETPLFGCGFYEPETEIIALPQFESKRIRAFPEVIAEKDDDAAMTVHANDPWGQAPPPRAPQTSTSRNCAAKDGDRKSRGNGDPERKSVNVDNNHRSRGSDTERRSRGLDTDRDSSSSGANKTSSSSMSSSSFSSSHGSKEERESLSSERKLESGQELLSVPVQPPPRRASGSGSGSGGSDAVEFFTTGSDPDSDGNESEGVSFLSAPETMPPKKPCRDTRNKMRFKRFFRPLRRSKSTGNTKEESTATFSFFPKQEADSDDRQSVDTGRGSMEPASDRETEQQTVKDTTNKDKKKKSITTEVREKLYVLRRRYTDLSLTSKDGKTEKPTTMEVIKNWSKTIELLLADRFGVQCFHAFLKSEFSEENIDFWIACESYKTLKPSKQPAQAQKIFAEFIAYQAPREINIDSVTRDVTCARMVQPDGSTFDAAQKRIQALMDKDSYPRFIQSPLYQQLVSGQSPLLS